MIVVMKPGSTEKQVEHVVKLVREMGLKDHVIVGTERTVVAVIGNDRFKDKSVFETVEGVDKVVPILAPYKMASREVKKERSVIALGGKLGGKAGGTKVAVIAGPCSVESKTQLLETAHAVKEAGAVGLRGGAFKPRTSPYAFQGLAEKGLELLAMAREQTGLAVVTEVMAVDQVKLVNQYADVLQVGARNMQNFNLLNAVGEQEKPVLLKRGMSATLEEFLLAAEYIMSKGNTQVMLCERGIRTYEDYVRNTLALAAVPELHRVSHLPVIVDPSQGTGKNQLVDSMCRAAVAAGADGLIIEVHNDPEHALTDGAQSITHQQFAAMMKAITRIAAAVDREVQNQSMDTLTPKQIVAELDKYIVGQPDAKRAVAVAVRNRWRRQRLPAGMQQDVYPKNILMVGPTGVGKTEIARRLAGLTGAPFIKVEATKFTEVGYHGRDVDSMIRDLLDTAIALVRQEMTESVKEPAGRHVDDRLLDYLLPGERPATDGNEDAAARRQRTREKLREQLAAGLLEDREIELSLEQRATAVNVLGQAGMEMDVELQSMFEKMLPSRRETRRMKVAEARHVLLAQEAEKLIDREKIHRMAIERVEQSGIVFLDEIDKICGTESKHGPDVSRQGVQRDLLPIVEGSTVVTKYGPVKTDHILFIAAGAFHATKPSDLMPELQGRFPIRVELTDLNKEDFVRILREPKNALTQQMAALLGTEGMEVLFSDDAIDEMAGIAYDVNRRTQNIGARRLYTILERVFEKISFEAPDMAERSVTITAEYVKQRLADVLKDEDLSKFIL